MNPCNVRRLVSGMRRSRMRPIPTPSASSPRFFAAPVRLVHLHDATQPVAPRPHHRASQFVQQRPGRLVAAQSQDTLQAQRADAVLLAGHLPHGPEPHRQWQLAVLEDGPRHHRRFPPAVSAPPQIAAVPQALTLPAPGTGNPLGPPHGNQVGAARRFGAEPPLQFQQRPRIILHHRKRHYRLGAVESRAYPYPLLTLQTLVLRSEAKEWPADARPQARKAGTVFAE